MEELLYRVIGQLYVYAEILEAKNAKLEEENRALQAESEKAEAGDEIKDEQRRG